MLYYYSKMPQKEVKTTMKCGTSKTKKATKKAKPKKR